MKITIIMMMCFFLCLPATGAKKRSAIHYQTIQRLVETEESFEVAIRHYHTLMRTAEVKGNERMQAECLFQLARIHYWQAQYSLSLAQTKRGLSIARRMNDKVLLATGYEQMGRLHYLFSPEQAQYYYRKCWQYSEQTDSAELAISILNNFNLILSDKDIALEELLAVDKPSLSPLTRAWLGYNITRALLARGHTDEAPIYLDYMRQYLQQYSVSSPLNAMYEYRMGQLKLLEGDTKQAMKHSERSMEIVRRNKLIPGIILNYSLASQIAEAENDESLALELYKKSVALRDSIFNAPSNMNFPDELIYAMMEYIADDKAKIKNRKNLLTAIWSGLILLAGASLLYYFKSAGYHKKSATAIASIIEHETNSLQSRMKNHLMKIMYAYKAGVSFCMKQIFNPENLDMVDDLSEFEKNMQNVDRLMDSLLVWVESNPNMTPEKLEFDATEAVQNLVGFYNIGFAFKHLTCRFSADSQVMVRGDKYLFTIALEYLFFSLCKVAAEKSVIHISVSGVEGWGVAVSIADPKNTERTLEKEIFAQRAAELETSGIATYSADWDFNIFAECTVRNGSKVRMDCTPEKGTVYYYLIPV